MKGNSNLTIEKVLIPAIFLILMFVMFFFNIKELFCNIANEKTEISPYAVAADLENVESATYSFININGLYQGLMQRNYMYDVNKNDELIRVQDKYLVSAPSDYDYNALVKSANILKKSQDWLSEKGIPMIYVQSASKMTLSAEDSIKGKSNTSYRKVADFMRNLDMNSITCLDSREWINDKGMSAFFRTDHHWSIDTCLTVSSEICSYLNTHLDMGIDEETFAPSSFNAETHTDAFLGAEGRRTGRYYVGLDDFSVIVPKYKTDFNVDVVSSDGEHFSRKGNFENSVMDSSKDPSHYSFEDSAYYIYWGGDYSSIHVHNRLLPDGKSAVIIKDSYGVPVTAFMTGAFKDLDILDLRYYSEEKRVNKVISDANPDVVIFIYGSGYLEDSKVFDLAGR